MITTFHSFEQEVQMALGPFATTLDRSRATAMTLPVVVDPLIPAAGRQSPETNPWGFVETLTATTWLGVGLALLAMTACLLILSRVDARHNEGGWVLRTFDVLYEFAKCLLQQGGYFELSLMLMFFSIQMNNSYLPSIYSGLSRYLRTRFKILLIYTGSAMRNICLFRSG